jgi:hypothetical protein
MKKRGWIILGIVVALVVAACISGYCYYSNQESFEVKGALIQMNMPLDGEVSNNNIKLINNKNFEHTLYLKFENLDGIASLGKQEIVLEAKGEKILNILFEDSFGEVKTYVGKLIIENFEFVEEIPIVLNVQDERSPFSIINTPLPNYQNVYPGGEFGIQIKVIESNPSATPKSVDMVYSLMNFEGEVLESTESNVLIGDSWTKVISIPKEFKKGDYVFTTSIEYKGVKSISAHKFSVEDKKQTPLVNNLKFFVIIILIFVLGILVLFFHFAKTRDEFLVELKKQQTEELSRNLKFIDRSKLKVSVVKDVKKKKTILKKLDEAKKKVVKRIKKKQKAQRKELVSLKKRKHKKSDMKNKMDSWKSQGFKMEETAEEMKISKQDMGKQLNELKSKGYKF